ncbi:MAG: orotidine-5'-phosphate decarboxylase [Pseudomonadota bacterium]
MPLDQDLSARDRIIVALDLPTVSEAQQIISGLGELAGFYKIGYQLAPIGGYDLAKELVGQGKRVFLDLKLLDIGSIVEKGVHSLASLGADFLTVHADHDAIAGAAEGRGDAKLKIMAVTVLTSWDQDTIRAHGFTQSVEDLVLRRAEMALKAGADGFIASAAEAPKLRAAFGDEPLIVTPGIRPQGADVGDQKRVVTPSQALDRGADYLVVGRPITAASDKKNSLQAIVDELEGLA